MADIMMCNADECPNRAFCRRNKASGTVPDKYYQSYWVRDANTPSGNDCPHFWPVLGGHA